MKNCIRNIAYKNILKSSSRKFI